MTRKKKLNNFQTLVSNILDSLDSIVPKGTKAVEVIGALEVAKIYAADRLNQAVLTKDMFDESN